MNKATYLIVVLFPSFSFMKNKNKAQFIDKEFNIKKFEKKIRYNLSKNQRFIEYSELGIFYLKNILSKNK